MSKNVFKSIGGLGSIIGIITGLVGWYNAFPTELITETQMFLTTTVAAAIALLGRWRAVSPLHLFKK